jgi:hypothetical protein
VKNHRIVKCAVALSFVVTAATTAAPAAASAPASPGAGTATKQVLKHCVACW